MKRTRQELVDFLQEVDRAYCVGKGWSINMADKLIQNGWVVCLPNKFWICRDHGECRLNRKGGPNSPLECDLCNKKPVFVRLEDSNE